jgi:oxygen-dependent protoporphyrinogen oxidase
MSYGRDGVFSAAAMTHVAVVGGGISGLSAAHRLRQLLGDTAKITIVEADQRLGGKLRTTELAGSPFDMGAEAFLARRPEALDLISECGLGKALAHPTSAKATIRAGGRTAAMPPRTLMGIPSSVEDLRELLSAEGLDRVSRETQLPDFELPEGDLELGAVLRERFGSELVDRLVDPLLGGVYAGGADGLGLRSTMPALVRALAQGGRSLTQAAATVVSLSPQGKPVFGTLVGGFGLLIDRLAQLSEAEILRGVPVRNVRRVVEGWELELGAAGVKPVAGENLIKADAVLLAVPAPAARRLLSSLAPAAKTALAEIELASMAVVALALPNGTVLPEASGVLVGVGERARSGRRLAVKAMTFSSRKWAHYAQASDPVVVRGSIGRFGENESLGVDDEELVRRTRADLAELTGVTAEPIDVSVTRWGGGLPQYAAGHGDRIRRIEGALRELPGLEIAGSVMHGVGIPACIATARAAAGRIVEELVRSSSR